MTGAVSVAALLAFGFEPAATRAATLIQYGAYLILAAHLMTVIAALAWTWRTWRRPLPLAILTTGAAVLGTCSTAPSPRPPLPRSAGSRSPPPGSVLAGAATLLAPGLLTRMRSSRLLAVTATAGALLPASHADRPRPQPGTHQR